MRRFRDDPLPILLSLGMVAAGIYWGREALADYLRFPQRPLETDVTGALAAGRQWVSVAPGAWECDQLFHRGVSRFVPARGADGRVLVADFQHEISCEQVTAQAVAGVVHEVPEHLRSDFVAAGLEGADTLLSVTDADQKQDSLIGVLLCFVGAPLLVPFMVWLLGWQQRLHQWSEAQLTSASAAAPESEQADVTVRKHGALLLGLGASVMAMSQTWWQDWWVCGLVPLSVFGAVALALGVFEVAFPKVFRRLYKRSRGR